MLPVFNITQMVSCSINKQIFRMCTCGLLLNFGTQPTFWTHAALLLSETIFLCSRLTSWKLRHLSYTRNELSWQTDLFTFPGLDVGLDLQ
jgi:hypothetical protein